MTRLLLSLTSASFLVCYASTALAQEEEAPPPPEYEELVREALAESAAGRFEEARALFRRAHEVHPNARTLRGIGMLAFELRDYPDAIRHLSLALADARRPLTEEQRAEALALLERAYAFVGRYDLSAVPEGARILVDGHPADAEPDGTLILRVGTHEVVVRTAARSWEGRFTVRGGEREPLPLVFSVGEPLATPNEPEVTPPIEPAVPAAPPDPSGPIGVIVAGALLVAAGVATLIAGAVDEATVENARDVPWTSIAGAYERTPILSGVGGVALGVGAAATVLGSLWLALGGSGEQPRAAAGVQVGGRW